VTSRELIAWAALHERRARTPLSSPLVLVALAGGLLAAWVGWRLGTTAVSASHAWLAGTIVAFAVTFMRVPFHLYWRADAALLAQLPIEGGPLFDAALWRCIRTALVTTLATAIGAAPLVASSLEMLVRHLVLAGALGIAAALFIPAVATWAAALVAASQSEGMSALRVATGIDATTRERAASQAPAPSTALLGALPGFASTLVIVGVLVISPWLTGGTPSASPATVLGILVTTSVVSITGARWTAPRVMGTILRDVSALDRQQLATLEIRPPTAIERLIARMIGDAALPYAKDARLMRRRYPMAFALGALVFLVLAIVGLARPEDATPWLTASLGGATLYGLAVGARLYRPPVELARLSRTLPIRPEAGRRAKLAWLTGWWLIYVALPGLFAALRQTEPLIGLALVGGGTLIVLGAVVLRRA
jgi:hypothetical protein